MASAESHDYMTQQHLGIALRIGYRLLERLFPIGATCQELVQSGPGFDEETT
jgi:hypothetical protein